MKYYLLFIGIKLFHDYGKRKPKLFIIFFVPLGFYESILLSYRKILTSCMKTLLSLPIVNVEPEFVSELSKN